MEMNKLILEEANKRTNLLTPRQAKKDLPRWPSAAGWHSNISADVWMLIFEGMFHSIQTSARSYIGNFYGHSYDRCMNLLMFEWHIHPSASACSYIGIGTFMHRNMAPPWNIQQLLNFWIELFLPLSLPLNLYPSPPPPPVSSILNIVGVVSYQS